MTTPATPRDPADGTADGLDQFTPIHRNGGWTVEQWIAYLDRHPHAALPSGVGGMIVAHYRRQLRPAGGP